MKNANAMSSVVCVVVTTMLLMVGVAMITVGGSIGGCAATQAGTAAAIGAPKPFAMTQPVYTAQADLTRLQADQAKLVSDTASSTQPGTAATPAVLAADNSFVIADQAAVNADSTTLKALLLQTSNAIARTQGTITVVTDTAAPVLGPYGLLAAALGTLLGGGVMQIFKTGIYNAAAQIVKGIETAKTAGGGVVDFNDPATAATLSTAMGKNGMALVDAVQATLPLVPAITNVATKVRKIMNGGSSAAVAQPANTGTGAGTIKTA